MYCLEKQARSEEELTSPRGNGSVSNIGHNSVPVPSPMQTHFEIGICIHIPQNDLTEMDKSLKQPQRQNIDWECRIFTLTMIFKLFSLFSP